MTRPAPSIPTSPIPSSARAGRATTGRPASSSTATSATLPGDQTVTRSRLGEQTARAHRVRLDLAPEPRDVDVEVMGAVAAPAAPDLVEDHPVGQQPSFVP